MRVGFLSVHCCIRTFKQSFVLQNEGIDGVWMQQWIANQHTKKLVGDQRYYETQDDFKLQLMRFGKTIDLFHIHDQPNWMITATRELFPDKPIIADIHDFRSVILENHVPNDEVTAVLSADAYIFPSEGYLQYAKDFYRITKPAVVVHSFCPEKLIEQGLMPHVGGIVYEGMITVRESGTSFVYADYRNVAKKLTDMHIPFFLYGGSNDWQAKYLETGAMCMQSLEYFQMIKNLTRFDWGLVGGSVPCRQWEWAFPNKLGEYLAAGIPIICFSTAKESAEFVKKHGVGVVVDTVEDILDIYDQHDKYRKRVLKKRKQFTMESQVHKILGLYDQVLGVYRPQQKTEMGPEYYDAIYSQGYDTSRYQPIYDQVMRIIGTFRLPRVLEIGCGTGDLAKMMIDKNIEYRGLDISYEAIRQCKITNRLGVFHQASAYDEDNFSPQDYNIVVMIEVLEHLDDLRVIKNIPAGTTIIASVPNYDDLAHLRTYTDIKMDIIDRFGPYIDNIEILTFGPNGGPQIYLFHGKRKGLEG